MADLSVDTLCKVYVRIRAKKADITKAYEAEVAELDGHLDKLAATMKDKLAEAGAKSIKTEHGTVYATTKTRFYPMDFGAFGDWIVKNNAIDLLEKRVAQTNMAKWLEENPTNPPPGVQAETVMTVTVRKA